MEFFPTFPILFNCRNDRGLHAFSVIAMRGEGDFSASESNPLVAFESLFAPRNSTFTLPTSMISHFCPRTAVRLALAFCTWPLFAQTAQRYDGAAWSLLDSTAIMSAAADITAAKYPDSDDVTVESKLMRIYHADGTAESQDETFTKVLTEKGKRNNRTVSRGFMLPYSSVTVVRLEILQPGGTVVPVDVAANSKESIDDSQMEANIYDPNVRLLPVNIPQLDPGAAVHLVTRTTTDRPVI